MDALGLLRGETAASSGATRIQTLLTRVMNDGKLPNCMQAAAAVAVDVFSDVLFPSPAARVAVLHDLLVRNESEPFEDGTGGGVLLSRLLSRLSSSSSAVQQFLPPREAPAGTDGTGLHAEFALPLLRLLTKPVSSADGEAGTGLATSAMRFLIAFQHNLVSAGAEVSRSVWMLRTPHCRLTVCARRHCVIIGPTPQGNQG